MSPPHPADGRPPAFDYGAIPAGHYDRVLREGRGIRRLWHLSKFERVLDYLPRAPGQSLLDVGCFAGSFLSLADPERFSRQVGVDILPAQVEYANARYGTPWRRFVHLPSVERLDDLEAPFDCATLVEVIEHLAPPEIAELLARLARLVRPGGRLVITTPNYASAWPAVEWLLNRVSDVSYEEQHVTRFTYFGVERRLALIWPGFEASFAVDLKTTTHLLTPFLAGLSFDLAHRLSRLVPHARWRQPFGNLVLLGLVRR